MKDYQTTQRKKDLKLVYTGPMATKTIPYFDPEPIVNAHREKYLARMYDQGIATYKASL